MANLLTTDSLTSRRIVHAFFDFLHSVEPAPGVDLEGLEVAKDCLAEVFQLDQLLETERPEPNLLVNIFRSQERSTVIKSKASQIEGTQAGPSSENHAAGDSSGMANVQGVDRVRESDDSGVPKDELFGHFFDALEKIQFFRTNPNGDDDHVLLDRATCLFHDAVNEIERSGSMLFDRKSLADALKILGNKAMQSKLYSDAIERYTCAIALDESDAVYYCNRAAAYTQVHKYNEAIKDSLKSIEIDPNYSKAYSRMGLAYYAQGKYSDAINKGFRKALELDPNNDAVKENIRVAEQKLIEEQEQRNQSQNYGYHFAGGSGDQAAPPPFGSFPANIASMFTNLAGNASHNDNEQSRAAEGNGTHARFVDGYTVPTDIASMVENLARTFRGQNSEIMPSDQTHEYETTYPSASVSFEGGTIPGDLAGMFMNMTGQGSHSQGQSAQQGGNVGGSDEPGIGRGANITFNFGGETPEELNRAFSSMMGMFSGGGGDLQGNTDARPDSR